jgi:DNA-binding response OmpR family regulator
MTILLVDDDPKLLLYLKTALSKAGYSVLAAKSARDALSILAHTPVNLIIADVLMPEVDGHEFCGIVRSEPAFEYIPIIFLTALSSVDDVATGMIAGADDYLIKPIHLKDLLQKVEEYAM